MKLPIWIVVLFAWFSASVAHADWLSDQAHVDGSFAASGDLATSIQGTSESVRTLRALNRSAEVTAAESYLSGETYTGTEYVARQIIARSDAGLPSPNQIAELQSHQNPDGGFGELSSFASTAFDTAFALEAMFVANNGNSPSTGYAIAYLLQNQRSDGSWVDTAGTPDVYTTAIVARALNAYRTKSPALPSAIANANNFLLSQRRADATWGEPFLTAHALITLTLTSSDVLPLKATAVALRTAQQSNGSWANDVYSTALALRALLGFDARVAGAAPTASGGSIAGYVLRAGSSEPVANAIVSVTSVTGLIAQTNSDGYFVLNGVPIGDQTLVAAKSGFTSTSTVTSVRTAQINSAGEIYLSQNATVVLVKGSVFDSTNKLPIGAVAISLSGPTPLAMNSNADGSFDFGAIAPGHYSVTFQKAGYYDVIGQFDAASGVVALQQGLLLQGGFLDASAGQLVGQLVNADTNQPIASASITVGSLPSVITGTDGSFTINSVSRGAYQLQATAPGFLSSTYSFVFAPGILGDVGTLKLFPMVGSQSPTQLTLKGTVVDAIDNRALSGASVTVLNNGQVATADPSGKFTLTGLSNLSFNLSVAAAGHETRTFTGTASAFGDVAGTFALPPTGGDPTATVSVITGVVKDSTTAQPIAGARVTVPGNSLSATTGADGGFRLANISPLGFSLNASAPLYTARSYSIELTQFGDYNIDIDLNPDPSAQGASFQVLSLSGLQAVVGANTQQTFAARIANLTGAVQSALVLADVVDASGVVVATITPFAPATQTPTTQLTFNAGEPLDLVLPWNTSQQPPGAYRVLLYLIKPGSITRDLTRGIVLAQSETYTSITPTSVISGQTASTPPLTQAGASVPVVLSALIINSGNIPLVGTGLTLTVTDPVTSQVIHTANAVVPVLNVGNNTSVAFGSWIPTKSGNLIVKVAADDPATIGTIAGTLYVGDKATGAFTVSKSVVPIGTQTIRASVALSGVDVRTGTSTDPLFFAVKNAVKKGGQFVATNALQWNGSNRCLGCHIQTQSLFGVASAMDKADIDAKAVQYLYNDVAGSLRTNGELSIAYHDYYPQTQTTLGIWALSAWHNARQVFRTIYRGSLYQLSRMQAAGDLSWWVSDYCSLWFCDNASQTMTSVKGIAATLRMAGELGTAPVNDYTFEDTGFASGIRDLMGMQKGPDGWIWYLDGSGGGLYARNPTTGAQRTIATNLGNILIGLAVRDDGTAYVSSRTSLVKIKPDGTQTTILGTSNYRWDAALGPDGAIYVADANAIYRITADDQVSVYVSGGLLNTVTGLSFDSAGNLYASDVGSYQILKIAPDRTVSVFADGLPFQPTWLRRGADGFLYASTQRYDFYGTVPPGIFRIDPNGVIERLPIFDAANGYGQNAVGAIDGEIYVHNAIDQHLYRLKITTQDTSQLPRMSSVLASAARYTLTQYRDNNSANDIHAMRLITLAEARVYISDTTLLAQIDSAISEIATLLRNRQHADGGWTYTTGRANSDSYTTAFVGLALDYTNPSANDPAIRNSIAYLLNAQTVDGSWPFQDGVFATKLGPTSFVMAYLPSALDRLGGIDTDLSLTIPSNNQLSNPSLPPTAQITNADNSVSYTWSLQGVTAKARSIDFDLTLRDMAFNEDRSVASSAYLQFANSFSGEKLKSGIDIPHVQASRDLSLNVSTDHPSYPASTDVVISSQIVNVGPAVSTAQLHLVVRSSDGATVADLGTTSLGVVASGGTVSPSLTWNTASYLTGGYQIYGQLLSDSGSAIYESTASFAIVTGTPGNAVLSATITPDKSVYQSWDAVMLTSRVRNISKNSIQPKSIVEVTVQAPTGQTLFSNTYSLSELEPLSLRDVLSALNLADAASGAYPVALVVKDAFTRNVIANASTSFRVERKDIQAFIGNVKVASTPIAQGNAELCTDTISNLSSTAGRGVNLTQTLVDLTAQSVLDTKNQTVDFGSKQTQTLLRSVSTGALPPGDYACVLSATINGDTRQIGSAAFSVVIPPILIDSALTLGKHGRVLILVDAPNGNNASDPFGPASAPDLNVQRAHIESILKANGWSYTIVNNATNFEREFNTGGYEVYAILVEAVKLSESLQDKMVDAVKSGAGLIVAGNHDQRNGRLDRAMGIKSTGKNLNASSLIVLQTEVMNSGEEAFPIITPPNAIDLNGATAFANYRLMNPKSHCDPKKDRCTEPAATFYRYGQGKSVYAGFDLPLEGAAAGDDSTFGKFFAKSLEFVHPTTLDAYVNRVLPIELSLMNRGIATSGRVIVMLPAGAVAVATGTGAAQADGMIAWTYSLAKNQVLKLPFWVRMPNQAGDTSIRAHLQTGTPGNYLDYSDTTLVVRVLAKPAPPSCNAQTRDDHKKGKYGHRLSDGCSCDDDDDDPHDWGDHD